MDELTRLQSENEALKKELEAVSDLARFMCNTWTSIDSFVYKNCSAQALMQYPVIQGTSNQSKLQAIGAQPYNTANIRLGVQYLTKE